MTKMEISPRALETGSTVNIGCNSHRHPGFQAARTRRYILDDTRHFMTQNAICSAGNQVMPVLNNSQIRTANRCRFYPQQRFTGSNFRIPDGLDINILNIFVNKRLNIKPSISRDVSNDHIMRPLQNPTFYPISVSCSNFNPRNTQCIPVVKIFAFLELEQKSAFFKGLSIDSRREDTICIISVSIVRP